jgi:hypothetical protein
MTSRQQSITSMISVVAEGRCSLLATYQIFQFIVGYAMAQAFATNLMYTYGLMMGNYQYLIQVSQPQSACVCVCLSVCLHHGGTAAACQGCCHTTTAQMSVAGVVCGGTTAVCLS